MSDEGSGDDDVSARGSTTLEDAYHCLRRPLHRVRYGERQLVEGHVHVEALTVRDGVKLETIAKGVRFLLRAQPVDEPADLRPPMAREPSPSPEFQHSWMHPVSDGLRDQHSRAVFVDLADVPLLIDGLSQILKSASRWLEGEAYSTATWKETVFAWNDALVFNIVQSGDSQSGTLKSRTPSLLSFDVHHRQFGTLRNWLTQMATALHEAP